MEKLDKEKAFIQNTIYPNASDIFNTNILPIENIKNDCIYILDTNALLIPYTTTSTEFNEIKKVYSALIKNNQLLIPGQVAREFAKNRPEKIKTLFQQLSKTQNSVQKPLVQKSPLLEELNEYKEVVKLEKEVHEIQAKYSKNISLLLDKIKSWRWNDPVSEAYNALFSPQVIYDPKLDHDKVLTELDKRNKHSIPPGFKDKSKEDGGIGDLLIWISILEIAVNNGKHIIFVSGDEKTDWFHRMEKQALYPRFELITEFQHKTNNKTFHIIQLSELLSLFGADKEVIKGVELKEKLKAFFEEKNKLNTPSKLFAVLNWIKSLNLGKQIITGGDFPEIIVNHGTYKEGVEIKLLNKKRKEDLTIYELYFKALDAIKNGATNAFTIFYICDTLEDCSYFYPMVAAFKEEYKNEFITFIIGFVHETFIFEPIYDNI